MSEVTGAEFVAQLEALSAIYGEDGVSVEVVGRRDGMPVERITAGIGPDAIDERLVVDWS